MKTEGQTWEKKGTRREDRGGIRGLTYTGTKYSVTQVSECHNGTCYFESNCNQFKDTYLVSLLYHHVNALHLPVSSLLGSDDTTNHTTFLH